MSVYFAKNLIYKASKPYLTMLEDWIYKGQINDPYNEFMINEDKEIIKEKLKEDFNEKYPFYLIFKRQTKKFNLFLLIWF